MRSNSHKRGIITEELCAITDGPWEAVLLRQLIYWLTRCDTIDAYLDEVGAEEKGVPKTGGWVYKSARAIGEEIMMQSSPRTVRKRLKALVEKGYADEREDPERKMDRRKQYRVNVVKVEGALRENGYSLQSVMGKDWGVVSEKVAAFYESNAPSADSTNGQTKTKRHARDRRNTETTSENTVKTTANDVAVSSDVSSSNDTAQRNSNHAESGSHDLSFLPEQDRTNHLDDIRHVLAQLDGENTGQSGNGRATGLDRLKKLTLGGKSVMNALQRRAMLGFFNEHGWAKTVAACTIAGKKEMPPSALGKIAEQWQTQTTDQYDGMTDFSAMVREWDEENGGDCAES